MISSANCASVQVLLSALNSEKRNEDVIELYSLMSKENSVRATIDFFCEP